MKSSASGISRVTEVQEQEKTMMHQSPFLSVNPISSPPFGSPWVSGSTPVFPIRGYGHGALAPDRRSQGKGIQIEFMFSKMLMPSDVSKLNRLLIPRQDAEKYFPMGLGPDGSSLLTFEDSSGVLWHFRYSFWQSSRTYVLTKGWMSFVKEKRLSDGDIVSFYQGIDAAGINHRFIYFKKKYHGSLVPQHVTPTIITTFGALDDNWVRKALCSSSHYRANLEWKHLPHGSMGTPPPNFPIPQPPLIPLEESLGSDVGPAKKRVRLFGVDLNTESNESCRCHGHTNNVG